MVCSFSSDHMGGGGALMWVTLVGVLRLGSSGSTLVTSTARIRSLAGTGVTMTRSVARQYLRVLLAALTVLLVSCGGTDAAGDAAQSSAAAPVDDQDSGGGAVGAPFDEEGDDLAVGTPITIPDFQFRGADFEEQLPGIKQTLAERCGGELCVKVAAVVNDKKDGNPCQITDLPPAGSTAKRGSTVTFEIAKPCDASPSEGGGDPPPDGGGDPPPDGGEGEPTTADPDEG